LPAGLLAGLGAALATLFFSALRALAGGAALARADGFDFAAVFLSLDATLAMTDIYPREHEEVGGLTPRLAGSAQGASRPGLHVEALEQAKARQTDEDQIDGDHEIEEPRHDQDKDACDQGHDGLNMG
jgi:hypothetical protein